MLNTNWRSFQKMKCREQPDEQKDRQQVWFRIGTLEESYEPTKQTEELGVDGKHVLLQLVGVCGEVRTGSSGCRSV